MKRVFLLLLLACCLLIAPAAAAGGSGTAASPYIIQTAVELQSIQNNLAAYYVLGNDIDLSGVTWTPIGSISAPFIGQLDGNSHTIKNLNIDSYGTNNRGLFGAVSSATIKNLNIDNFVVNAGSYSAVLCGYSSGNTIISDVSISNSVFSKPVQRYNAGIFIGECSGTLTLTNCESHNNSLSDIGGSDAGLSAIYVGRANNCVLTIDNCLVSESKLLSHSGNVGLFVGANTNGGTTSIENSEINNSIISARAQNQGLLIGSSNSNSNLIVSNIRIYNSISLSDRQHPLLGYFHSTGTHTLNNININGVSISPAAGAFASNSDTDISVNNVDIINSVLVSSSGWVSGLSYANVEGMTVTKCDIENTNIYGPSGSYTFTPGGISDSSNTASGITNVPNRYLYASGLSYSTSGNTATFTIDDRQGAAVVETSTGAAAAINYDYGDGNTGTTDTHTYAAGIYTAGVTLSSYLQTTPLSFYTTPINIGIPTYTANTITQQDADIVIDAGQLYQAQTHFVLPSTTSELEFFADNLFVVASGNAVYLIDTATEQIEPVSNTTGTTAEKIYLGEHAAIITDIDGNTAVYQYAENNFHYLASGDNQQIATTQNYAGIIINGELNIYDLSEPRKIGDITASVSQLAGNDYADTFAGYSGSTFYYWWIDNGEIKSGSQTMPNPITEVKQIPQTQNYIITTEKNTVIVSVSATGVYELVSTSDTEEPLTHPQATTSNIIIGVHPPNEVYIVGADGSTTGTYQTGATLNDASISKATGLYAITGGNDQQAYILRKDQSSTWTLAQTIKANGALSHTQISTTGVYASLVSGVNLYLLKISTNTDTNYYLNGIVIDTDGLPYNGDITINGEKVQTDKSGKFTYPITPGVKYIINAKGSITEYTATNAALQQIAIRIKAGLLSTDVTYSADYSAESQAIIMAYDDAAGKTTAVNWKIYETANNTLVATYTGNTASYPIEAGDVYNNYYVQLSADRGGATVTNTWSITPAGGQPIDLYGLDEDGRNIIFGFLLLLLAGLFGVMHSRSGAIIVALGACVMRYLELITIPWILITIAAVLAIVAAIAHGGQNR